MIVICYNRFVEKVIEKVKKPLSVVISQFNLIEAEGGGKPTAPASLR